MSSRYIDAPVHLVKSNPRNARTHSAKQIRQIAASIRELGFAAPVLIDEHNVLIAGHGRWQASILLGMTSIPAIRIDGLRPGN
jgi:ParB-like chromosome segregation protein Spo0J